MLNFYVFIAKNNKITEVAPINLGYNFFFFRCSLNRTKWYEIRIPNKTEIKNRKYPPAAYIKLYTK